MASLKQADRLMQFTSPLGKDELLIESIEGSEGISRLFEYNVDLLATVATTIDPKKMIGAKVSVAIALSDAVGSRYVNGIVASFEQRPGDTEFNVYRARIVPALWQLTLSANCKVFQNKSVLDIVKDVLNVYGLTAQDNTDGDYPLLDYCTQYSETDFHFFSRILEESGIFYWFEHSDSDNKIVLGDSRTAYEDCAVVDTVPFALNLKGAEGAYGSVVTDFSSRATMVSGKHALSDYNYRTYARADAPEGTSASDYGKNAFEQYRYPAGAEGYANDTTDTITDLQKIYIETRGQASDAVAEIFSGVSSARSLCAGYTFTLEDNPRDEFNRKYLLTAVSFSAEQVPPYRATDQGKNTEYQNQFTAVSSDITYKAPITCEKPRIYGPQTATVVGASGEEIYLDDLGRAKVQFFWDKLDSKGSTDNTTWVRVAQGWAGNGWGTYFWPRVNDEVVVQFLNGDPDNPVITGSVYNGKNSPPYALPANGTRSGIMTRSSKVGSASTANELRFEDKKGSEQIYIHAEKDVDISIENDRRGLVKNNDSLTVTQNQTEKIGGNFNRQIGSNLAEKIGSNSDLSVGSNLTESVGSNHALKVGSNQAISVGSAYSLNANSTVYINAGQSVVIQAGMELTLLAGGNFVNIGPSGVAISGTMVLINSGGAPGSGSAGQVGSPASPTSPDAAEDTDGSGGPSAVGQGSSGPAASSAPAGAPSSSSAPSAPSPPANPAAALGGAAAGALGQAAQAGQQAVNQAMQQVQQTANQAAQAAQQAAQAAKAAVEQAAAQAQGMADQVMAQARAAYQQAAAAAAQAQQAAAAAVGQAKAAAEQAAAQAQAAAQQCAQAGAAAAQQAQQEANQVKQQAQAAAAQAQQAAQQAQQQAQQAVNQAKQAAQQAASQGQAAAAQAETAAKQAAAQAQQSAAQAQQAAKSAEQQAQGAASQVKNAASGAANQAQQAAQGAQQAASQATKGLPGL